MKFDPTQLNKLIEQVSDDVVTMLAKADEAEKATLAKADPGEEAPGEGTPSGSSAEGSQPEASPDAGAPEAPEASPPAGEPDGDEGAPPEAAPQEGTPGDEQTQNPAEDASAGPEALVAEYGKLPPEELKMHVMASLSALMQSIGGQPGGQPGAEGEAPGAEAPQAPPEAPMAPPEGASPEGTQPAGQEPPMGKKEFSSEGSGGKIVKSELETRLATLEKSNKELEEKLGAATDGLRRFVEKSGNQAMRKSIASVSFTGKPGEAEGKQMVTLSKSEAIKKLNALTADREAMGKLQKSDREKISQYTIGTIPQSEISHLLK
jgi:hypothetical protein